MAEADKPTFPFRIRRIPDEPARPQAGRPEPPTPEPARPEPRPEQPSEAPAPATRRRRRGRAAPSPPPAAPEQAAVPAPPSPVSETASAGATGGRFASPSGLLSFLGTVAGARLAHDAVCRRGPDSAWWAEVEVSWTQAATLVWAAGGQPFAREGRRWRAVAASGEAHAAGLGGETLEVETWPQVDLADLLAGISLRARRLAPLPALDVLVPGTLGRWALRRAAALGVQVSLVPALRRPLQGQAIESGVLLVRLRAGRGGVPVALIHALSSLPYTLVGQPIGPGGGNLLIDARYRPPLAESLLSGMIPEGEVWALGAPDVGHWRLRLVGEEVDGGDLLDEPELREVEVPATGAVRLPAPLAVSLVPCAGDSRPIDGVLLDEAELSWVRPFLVGRPAGEKSFLLPGDGRYLLVGPGGLPGVVPFGIPLVHAGPGGLFVELGLDFYPPLPEGARLQAFDLKEGRVVAVVREGAFGFATERMVPTWTLWVGDPPQVKAGLSFRAQRLLDTIAAAYREQESQRLPSSQPARPGQRKPGDRPRLLAEAQRARLRGDLIRAAELLEEAGELGPAGRLYERAAARARLG